LYKNPLKINKYLKVIVQDFNDSENELKDLTLTRSPIGLSSVAHLGYAWTPR